MTDPYTAQQNLLMLERCPTWYEHLDKIDAAQAEEDRIYHIRTNANWELDEDGWLAPCPDTNELIPEYDWIDNGLPYPEDK